MAHYLNEFQNLTNAIVGLKIVAIQDTLDFVSPVNEDLRKRLSTFLSPHKYRMYHSVAHAIANKHSEYGHKCPFSDEDRDSDELIFDHISRSQSVWLDPCFHRRVWTAYETEDFQFLNRLGKTIQSVVKNKPETRGDLNYMKAFLLDLDRLGEVDLCGYDEDEWRHAMSIVKGLNKQFPESNFERIAKNYVGNNSVQKFMDGCSKWFVGSYDTARKVIFLKDESNDLYLRFRVLKKPRVEFRRKALDQPQNANLSEFPFDWKELSNFQVVELSNLEETKALTKYREKFRHLHQSITKPPSITFTRLLDTPPWDGFIDNTIKGAVLIPAEKR